MMNPSGTLKVSSRSRHLPQTMSSPVHNVEGFMQELGLVAIHGHIKNHEMQITAGIFTRDGQTQLLEITLLLTTSEMKCHEDS